MKFQLVFQWPAATIKDYDEMIAIEDTLVQRLGRFGKVDGHDVGSGQTNIFVHTDYPEQTLIQIMRIFGSKDFMIDLRAAYREISGEKYTILWPKDLDMFSVI